jgi:hypothetical protein
VYKAIDKATGEIVAVKHVSSERFISVFAAHDSKADSMLYRSTLNPPTKIFKKFRPRFPF